MNPVEPFIYCTDATERGEGAVDLFTFICLYSLNSSWREEEGDFKTSERGEQNRLHLSSQMNSKRSQMDTQHYYKYTRPTTRPRTDGNKRVEREQYEWWVVSCRWGNVTQRFDSHYEGELEINEEAKVHQTMVSQSNQRDMNEINDCVFHCFGLKSV